MSDEDQETDAEQPKKKGGILMPLIIGVVGAVALGGGAAFTVASGLVDIPGITDTAKKEGEEDGKKAEKAEKEKPKPAFVSLEPLNVTVLRNGRPRTLRMTLTLETVAGEETGITELTPRITDAFNTLLRAIDENDLTDPTALDRLRAQMIRRVRLATDGAPITNVLIEEYLIL